MSVVVGIPLYKDIPARMFKCLQRDLKSGIIDWVWTKQGTYIYTNRNQLWTDWCHTDHTILVMIDEDMTWGHDAIERLTDPLLADRGDIAAANYHMPITGRSLYRFLDRHGNIEVVPKSSHSEQIVEGFGTGFCAFHNRAILQLPPNPFNHIPREDGTVLNEDLSFCLRVKQESNLAVVGCEDVDVQHWKAVPFD